MICLNLLHLSFIIYLDLVYKKVIKYEKNTPEWITQKFDVLHVSRDRPLSRKNVWGHQKPPKTTTRRKRDNVTGFKKKLPNFVEIRLIWIEFFSEVQILCRFVTTPVFCAYLDVSSVCVKRSVTCLPITLHTWPKPKIPTITQLPDWTLFKKTEK